MPEVQTLGENIVVNQSSVHGEKTHEQDDITTAARKSPLVFNPPTQSIKHLLEEHANNLTKVLFSPRPLPQNHPKPSDEQDTSMTDITKHHREQERERDDRKQPRVHFLVRRDPIRIHNRLEPFRKLVRPVERRRSSIRAEFMQNRRYVRTRLLLGYPQKRKQVE